MRLETNDYNNNNYASKGVANAGLTTGIIGTVLGGLSTLFNGGTILGNNPVRAVNGAPIVCSDDEAVNRYEAKQSARIAELETEIKLRDANTYTDSKILETYQHVDGRLRSIESQISQQAVYNATCNATLSCMQGQIAQLQSLTKMIIPSGNICPEPMSRYNSWTAPTDSTSSN